MLGSLQAESAQANVDQMALKAPHFPGKAKHIIHLFMNGGPSHVDSFDPKPILHKYAGKPLPYKNLGTERPTGGVLPSPFRFRKYGQSGIEVSDLFPNVGNCIDDISVVRSMHANVPNHEPSLLADELRRGTFDSPERRLLGHFRAGKCQPKPALLRRVVPGGLPHSRVPELASGISSGRLSSHTHRYQAQHD